MKVLKDPKFNLSINFFHNVPSIYGPNINKALWSSLDSDLKNNGHLGLLLLSSYSLHIMKRNGRTNLSPLFLFEECKKEEFKNQEEDFDSGKSQCIRHRNY